MPLAVGDTLGRYELVRELGQGGMGVVYEARHKGLGTRFAIKVLLAVHSKGSSAAQRFEREGRIVAKLSSPHIVRTLDADTTPDGHPYIVMEFFDGCDLGKVLEERGTLRLGEVASIVRQLCVGLEHAHAEGVVHRDLKPANIFVALENGATVIKLMDFGIAKDLSSSEELTATSVMIGTTHYMAPEQVRSSRQTTAASDLWSVGVIVFRLLSGRHPFTGPNHADIAMSILMDPVPSLASFCPDIPVDFANLVARLLTKDPLKRLSSARELSDALAPFATEPVSLDALGPPPTVPASDSRTTEPTQGPPQKAPRMITPSAVAPSSLPLAPTVRVPEEAQVHAAGIPVLAGARPPGSLGPTMLAAPMQVANNVEHSTLSSSPASSDREPEVARLRPLRVVAATMGVLLALGAVTIGASAYRARGRDHAAQGGEQRTDAALAADGSEALPPLALPSLGVPSFAGTSSSTAVSATARVTPPPALPSGGPPGPSAGPRSSTVPSGRSSVPNHI
ncbi:MAG: serine/threonine-protein kinase [Polyangiaceae bacterium]